MSGKRVVVAGAGPAGVRAAIQAAEAGNQVFLVEPGLGAMTPDPQWEGDLLQVFKEKGITFVPNAEVRRARTEDGKVTLEVLKRSIRVDMDKCTSCDECIRVCPIHMWDDAAGRLAWRTPIDFHTTSCKLYSIVKEDMPACQAACPAHLDPRKYVGLIADGKFEESVKVIYDTILFPGIIGRVCPHPCESACNRQFVDEPISIRMLKRFVADVQIQRGGWPQPSRKLVGTKKEKVAIVGSGPAGLAAAHDLALAGYKVTIFEKLPVVGGMLKVGIPDYRLPPEILEREVRYVTDLGVEIRTSTPVGPPDLTLDDLMGKHGYSAVLIAVGAHKSMKLGIPGEQDARQGVVHGVDFLRDHNLGKEVWVGRKVGIVGGGNVAMDAARVSLRLGAEEVWVLYRRSRREMPASDEEVEAAMHEGIKFEFLVAPTEVLLDDQGAVRGCRFVRMRLGEPDASGRRRPIPIEGSEFELELDMLVPAIGQRPDLGFLSDKDSDIDITRWENPVVDPVTLMTGKPGVFACGDCEYGPSIAIEAIAAGRKAARSIIAYLEGREFREPVEPRRANDAEKDKRYVIEFSDIPSDRQKMPELEVSERVDNFREVELGYSEEQAVAEAKRCLGCRRCLGCALCWAECKPEAIQFDLPHEVLELEADEVLLAPPAYAAAAEPDERWSWGKHPDILTAPEFARLLSGDGPYGEFVLRPSCGDVPRSVAILQCVSVNEVPGEKIERLAADMVALARRAAETLPQGTRIVCFTEGGEVLEPVISGLGESHRQVERKQVQPVAVRPGGDGPLVEMADGSTEAFDLVVLCTGLRRPDFLDSLCKLFRIRPSSRHYWESGPEQVFPTDVPGVRTVAWKP